MLEIRKEEEEGSSFSYMMDTKSEQGLVCQARGEAPRTQAEGDGVLPFRRCAQQDRQEADHTAAELMGACRLPWGTQRRGQLIHPREAWEDSAAAW